MEANYVFFSFVLGELKHKTLKIIQNSGNFENLGDIRL